MALSFNLVIDVVSTIGLIGGLVLILVGRYYFKRGERKWGKRERFGRR